MLDAAIEGENPPDYYQKPTTEVCLGLGGSYRVTAKNIIKSGEPTETKFPGWLCGHGEWIESWKQTCSGKIVPAVTCTLTLNNSIEYDEQDWLCRHCFMIVTSARRKLQYNLSNEEICRLCGTARGVGPANQSIEFFICMNIVKWPDGKEKVCGVANRIGSLSKVDGHGRPLCRGGYCESPLPLRNSEGQSRYSDKWFVPRLKKRVDGTNRWICNRDLRINGRADALCITCSRSREGTGIGI